MTKRTDRSNLVQVNGYRIKIFHKDHTVRVGSCAFKKERDSKRQSFSFAVLI
jgi:hypothetical protein